MTLIYEKKVRGSLEALWIHFQIGEMRYQDSEFKCENKSDYFRRSSKGGIFSIITVSLKFIELDYRKYAEILVGDVVTSILDINSRQIYYDYHGLLKTLMSK